MNYYKNLLPLTLASIGILGNAAVANAVNFNFTYAPGTSFEQKVGFEMAGQIWSSYLKDDFTANIYVGFTDELPENVIGGALPGIEANVEYKKYREKLAEDDEQLSMGDWIADYYLENRTGSNDKLYAMVDGEEVKDINRINLTRANAKAVDIDSDSDKLDGYISMSDLSNVSSVEEWDMNFIDGNVSNNKLDYLSVAKHEIGHVLGFVSGVDDSGWLNVVTESVFEGKEIKKDKAKMFQPLDLFRYSEESAAAGMIDVSPWGHRYFSIDGGWTNLGNFSTGTNTDLGSDGYQASHWERKDGNALGIMDPVLNVGQKRKITDLDLIAFDVIGYDVDYFADVDLADIYEIAVDKAELGSEENMSEEVEEMIKDSKVYDIDDDDDDDDKTYNARRKRGRWQHAYFNNFSWQTIDSASDSQSVPEPGSTVGFLALGLLGLSNFLKRKQK